MCERHVRLLLLSASAVAAIAVLSACDNNDPAGSSTPQTARYRITLENLTTSQPLSPGVAVVHDASVRLFEVGSAPSAGLVAIAENGDPSVVAAALAGLPVDFVEIPAPTMRVGSGGATSQSVELTADADADLFSLAVMLICTNDGIVGLDSVALPGPGQTLTFSAAAYDAGSETNDELFPSLVDPCGAIGPVMAAPDGNQNMLPEDGGVVAPHPGISGSGDLDPAAHGWPSPPAMVSVERL